MASNSTEVLFNAQCPVCNFEISHYAEYSDKQGLPLRFDDLNSCELQRWGVTPDQAARTLHVRHNGEIRTGVDGFLILWEQMPRYRWLRRIVGLPGILQLSRLAYNHVLAAAIYRWHLYRRARQRANKPSP